MSVPTPDVEVPVSGGAYTSAKAVVATLTSAAGLVALFVTSVGDGSVSGAEWGTLLTAALTAVATIGGVWKTRNERIDN
jgi:hypothetical protein